MVNVSPEEFIRANRGLVKLIRTVNRAGKNGISTRRLLQQIGANEESQIYLAQNEGYVLREEREPEGGRGFKPVYNILTPKGEDLLEELGFVSPRGASSRGRFSYASKTSRKTNRLDREAVAGSAK